VARELADSHPVGSFRGDASAAAGSHELAAGKLRPCVSRNASRDVFDAVELLRREDLDRAKLRRLRRLRRRQPEGLAAPSRPRT